ncbi:tRNA (adenosine(37)-N6)-dimethylallyltransferase MiaA [Luteithermobacter gelatinilyticus]|uniref:tRNA (adenosine(37)-N6)-dimethylallyltransferase MiaA n=1 Tax=Luteithermobacter gelatinilyticus TaxID=2582913 RepID=UPI0011064C22|nr:tRNA (adenosine(37)-N6)-dimethylallyltransferase MiaA [Luteithermobacter gelatinilyticus]
MNTESRKEIILLAGPTASGKSALALRWASEKDGEIVNADSMQVYAELRDLTARPSEEEECQVPHHLYGVLGGNDACSAETWREMALNVLGDIWARGGVPIVVGGTGLYFRALLQGLSPIPSVAPEIRQAVRQEVASEGAEAAHIRLKALDPDWAAKIAPTDRQRIARGLEVALSTGRPLSWWQRQPGQGGLEEREDLALEKHVLMPDREWLYARCDARFEKMVREGRALEEVRSLMARGYSPDQPVMKSLGVSQLAAYLEGRLPLEEAIQQAQTATRQYAKRQMTWFRNQCRDWIHHQGPDFSPVK